jgi:hypothetical protein
LGGEKWVVNGWWFLGEIWGEIGGRIGEIWEVEKGKMRKWKDERF